MKLLKAALAFAAVILLPLRKASAQSCDLLVSFVFLPNIFSLSLSPPGGKHLDAPIPGETLYGLAFDSTGGTLFGVAHTGKFFEASPLTGSLINLVGNLRFNGTNTLLAEVTFHPVTRALYGVVDEEGAVGGLSPNDLVTINTTTAEVSLVGSPDWPSTTKVLAIEFASDGTLYAMRSKVNILYTLDPSDGHILTTKNISGLPADTGAVSLGWLPNEGTLLLSTSFIIDKDEGYNMYSLDPTTGSATVKLQDYAADIGEVLPFNYAYTGLSCSPSMVPSYLSSVPSLAPTQSSVLPSMVPSQEPSAEPTLGPTSGPVQATSARLLCRPVPDNTCYLANLVLMHTKLFGFCVILCVLPGLTDGFEAIGWTCGGCP